MKILVSITAALLVILCGGSGFCIWNLNRQIDDSMTELRYSVQEMIENLNNTIDADEELIFKDIVGIHHTLDEYSVSLQEEITETETKIALYTQRTGDIKSKTATIEERIKNCRIDTQSIYEKAREATVRISYKGFYLGSGFIVSFPTRSTYYQEAYVVTNFYIIDIITQPHHPLYNAEDSTVMITLSDGRIFRGDIFAGSRESNIALLKFLPVDYTVPYSTRDFLPLSPLSLADSSAVTIGDPVFIVGSPDDGSKYRMGLKESLTSGFVSQIKRGSYIPGNFLADMIQFDAAINFGNGGSPLLNKDGKVIGLVTARINPLLGEGISFALSSNQIKKVSELLKGKSEINFFGQLDFTYKQPDTGITVTDLLPKDIVANGNTIHSGVKVTELSTTTDIRKGDIITGIDDYPIQTSDDFYSCIVEHYSVGDEITLEVIRNGNPISVKLTLERKQSQ